MFVPIIGQAEATIGGMKCCLCIGIVCIPAKHLIVLTTCILNSSSCCMATVGKIVLIHSYIKSDSEHAVIKFIGWLVILGLFLVGSQKIHKGKQNRFQEELGGSRSINERAQNVLTRPRRKLAASGRESKS